MYFYFPEDIGGYVEPLKLDLDSLDDFVETLDSGIIRLSSDEDEDEAIEPLIFFGFALVVDLFASSDDKNLFIWGCDQESWLFRKEASQLLCLPSVDPEFIRNRQYRELFGGVAYYLDDQMVGEIASSAISKTLEWDPFADSVGNEKLDVLARNERFRQLQAMLNT